MPTRAIRRPVAAAGAAPHRESQWTAKAHHAHKGSGCRPERPGECNRICADGCERRCCPFEVKAAREHPGVNIQIREELPHVGVAVLSEALVIEAIHLCDLPRLVIAAQQEDAVAIPNCAAGKGGVRCVPACFEAQVGLPNQRRKWKARSREVGSGPNAYPSAQPAA
eukprot:scaffold27150_cov147-Isochrysis_galbana.AAC.4